MRIVLNDKLLSDSGRLLADPAVEGAVGIWGMDYVYQKSAISLPIFDTPFGSISLLYGPRQIGKTASLKLYLSRIADSDTICFLDCSTYLEKRDLYQSLSNHIQGRTTIVLDEVQSVAGWHQALRTLYSEGLLKNSRVWCTGSEARHLLESGERLPGRRGDGRVIFAKPWSFRKYLRFFGRNKYARLAKINFQHVNQRWLNELELSLMEEWECYLLTGGFPKCIGEYHTTGEIGERTFDTYTDWILGSWSRIRTPERSLRQLAKRLCANLNTRTSYQALTKGTDIQSPNTVRSLLEIQEDHFSLRMCPSLNLDNKGPQPAKQKKIYPLDPFIALVWGIIADRTLRRRMDNLPRLALDESAFFAQTLRMENQPEVGYLYSSRTKGEVDFYFENTCFELKSNNKPSKAQLELLNNCPHSFVLNRAQVPIMAFLIGEDDE